MFTKDNAMYIFGPPEPHEMSLRCMLLEQETIDSVAGNLHVITTWSWDSQKKVGTLWLWEYVVSTIQREAPIWHCEIWREDNEEAANLLNLFNSELRMSIEERWTDQ